MQKPTSNDLDRVDAALRTVFQFMEHYGSIDSIDRTTHGATRELFRDLRGTLNGNHDTSFMRGV